jgi:anti-sigma regulatory factor (Ser/Thr protein kinase)/serine/threonine protein phosphatase PrpC
MEIEVKSAHSQFVVDVSDSSHVGEARRTAVESAEAMGMVESEAGAVAIAVTELGTNLLKHGKAGKIVFQALGNGVRGLRVLSLDKGPGIKDITAALEDGYSTSGTSGSGLGAVRRLATHFDIYSLRDRGTCVLAEFWPKKKAPAANPSLHLGVISLPIRGEEVCGDGWASRTTADNIYLMVVDGLGHGMFAADAAREAERIFAETESTSPSDILRDCHDALKKTRGAAGAVAAINKEKRTLTFSGVGNISATLITPQGRRGLASHNGTLGHQMHKTQEFAFPWSEDSVLIMYSDGLISRWDLDTYPGIISRHPSIVAAALYRDFDRERDDVTVLVAKNSE